MRVRWMAVPLFSVLLGGWRDASASPFSVGMYSPNDLLFSRTGAESISFTHDLTASGFDPTTDTLTSATLWLYFRDDGDLSAEKVDIRFGPSSFYNNETIRSGTAPTLFAFPVGLLVAANGTLNVSLARQNGSFYFMGSRLAGEVNRERIAPIITAPVISVIAEPASLMLLGTGLAAGAFVMRRAKRSPPRS